MTTVEVLRRAKAEIEREGWEQGSTHFLDDHGPCCALGAIRRARLQLGHEGANNATGVLRSAAGIHPDYSVPFWNDADERTLDEVLAAFDRAISLASETERGR